MAVGYRSARRKVIREANTGPRIKHRLLAMPHITHPKNGLSGPRFGSSSFNSKGF